MPAAGSPGQAPMLLRTSFVQQGGEPGRPAAPNGWSSPADTCRAAFSCRQALWQFRFCAARPALRQMRQKGCGFLQRLRKCTAHPPTPHPSRRTAAQKPPPRSERRFFHFLLSWPAAAARGARRAAASAAAARARCLFPRRWPAAAAACRTRTPANSTHK